MKKKINTVLRLYNINQTLFNFQQVFKYQYIIEVKKNFQQVFKYQYIIEVKRKKRNVDSRVRTCAGEAQQISSLSP